MTEKTDQEIKKKDEKSDEKPIDRAFPEVQSGTVVQVHQKIKDVDSKGKEKERIQVFEGLVIARKHGREKGATITVRKDSKGFGVEKIFPLALPQITKIEVVKKFRTRRAKLYFTRDYKKKLREDRK
ncbi:50S ribosomal protein L19 [Patescibacteria group bacterium]|nr:50S ribosomal protein L19 [Patescibacteria group bacterium]MBU4511649.1 50S ribosomal protein L19 [Patescibacteria group bacterium]MCG2693286.1 50S ribosomal protein L19 [Candidatus Parcubacteria bacterium]